MRDNGNRMQSLDYYTNIELQARGAANDMCMCMSETCKNIMVVKKIYKSAGENDLSLKARGVIYRGASEKVLITITSLHPIKIQLVTNSFVYVMQVEEIELDGCTMLFKNITVI